jgi:hypothetical protein
MPRTQHALLLLLRPLSLASCVKRLRNRNRVNLAITVSSPLLNRFITAAWFNMQQKVSGGFCSSVGAQAICRIRGYLSTLRKQGLSMLTALEQALVGHPVSPAF